MSSYVCLCVCRDADSMTYAIAISLWIRTFGAMEYWVNYQGTHFQCELISKLAAKFRITDKLSVACIPRVNDTVEVAMRTIQAACRSLLTEL